MFPIAKIANPARIQKSAQRVLQFRLFTTTASDEVHIEENENIKKVILNRPKAFNALNHNMIRKLAPKYKKWLQDPSTVVVMKGAGEKAFCAGGDIRAIYDAVKSGDASNTIPSDFFYEEYQLNYMIASKKITQVSLLNGITMGGGVGLSVHGAYRVATDATLFAMPETAIGFFCDVGGSYFLPRLSHNWGTYLALTGARLKGKDLIVAGVATHYVPTERLADLEHKLFSEATDGAKVKHILEHYNAPVTNHHTDIVEHQHLIQRIFAMDTVEGIIAELEKVAHHDASEKNKVWAKKTIDTLHHMSPTSLKVVLEQMHRGKKADYEQCFKMEYRMSQAFMHAKSDFLEGVRATLVDKDKNPQWHPNKLSSVTKEDVERHFQPAKKEWTPSH